MTHLGAGPAACCTHSPAAAAPAKGLNPKYSAVRRYYELEADEYARKGISLSPDVWLVKLMVGAIDPTCASLPPLTQLTSAAVVQRISDACASL